MSRTGNSTYKFRDLLDEKSFETLEKLGFKFFRDRKTGKRLRIIKRQWQR